MTTITLQDIEARQSELAAMIERFKVTPTAPILFRVPAADIELQPGERYAGAVLGDDGKITHHLVLLPGEAEAVPWQDAAEWAHEVGGELPTRQEQALLYANLKAEFQPSWYWSSETYESDGSGAWGQNFGSGYQSYYHKSYEGRARAVRRFAA